jgi:hypothetical protein
MYLQCGPAWRGVFKDCLWCRSNTLVSSVIVNLLHSFRVCFSAPPTLCSVDTAESDLDEEEVVNTDISTEEKEQQKVIFSTRLESDFHIFSTRFECNFHIFSTRSERNFHIFPTHFECNFLIFSTRFECSFMCSLRLMKIVRRTVI